MNRAGRGLSKRLRVRGPMAPRLPMPCARNFTDLSTQARRLVDSVSENAPAPI